MSTNIEKVIKDFFKNFMGTDTGVWRGRGGVKWIKNNSAIFDIIGFAKYSQSLGFPCYILHAYTFSKVINWRIVFFNTDVTLIGTLCSFLNLSPGFVMSQKSLKCSTWPENLFYCVYQYQIFLMWPAPYKRIYRTYEVPYVDMIQLICFSIIGKSISWELSKWTSNKRSH